MKWYEIAVIVLAVAFVIGVIVGTTIRKYRNKKKGIPACCCDCSQCSACSHCTPIKDIVGVKKDETDNNQ